MYQELADQACTRITRGIVARHLGERPVTAVLDPYNPTGSTIHVNFTTSKQPAGQTDAALCHVNWVVCDSEWEAEFCRFVESQPQVRAYVKNHGLGWRSPTGTAPWRAPTSPTSSVLVDDGRGEDDLLHLVVEIKATDARTPRKRRPPWTPTGCRASTAPAPTAAGPSQSSPTWYTIGDEFAAATGLVNVDADKKRIAG